MKSFGLLLIVLSLGVFMVGCEAQTDVDSTTAPAATDTETPAVEEGTDIDVDAGAADPAEPAGDVDVEVTPPAEGDAGADPAAAPADQE